MTDVLVAVVYGALVLTGLFSIHRLLVGPTLADRIIALDLALVCLMIGIAVDAAVRDDSTWLNILVVIAIIGFTATVATTRFIESEADR
jgi:multicomponent Na+:H+ antiporter subunit F